MADNLAIKDAAGVSRALATKDIGSSTHLPKHILTDEAGTYTALMTEATAQLLLAALLDIAPANGHFAVTPSDVTPLTGVRSVVVGGAGTVVATVDGVDATYNCIDGQSLSIKATKIKAASTATGIVALT